MRITDAIAHGNFWVVEYERRSRVLAKALDDHIREMDALEGCDDPDTIGHRLMLALDKRLVTTVEELCGAVAPCECGSSPADTGPFPVLPATDAVQPSPGPWTFEANPLCVDGTPLIATLKDRDGKIVEGLIACNSPFLSDQGHANVAGVLAVPGMIEALREIVRLAGSVEGSTGKFDYEIVGHTFDAIESAAARAIVAATPIRRKPSGAEGGVA